MNPELTLLSEREVLGNGQEEQLEIFQKCGAKTEISDVAVLTGSRIPADDPSIWTRTTINYNFVRGVIIDGNRIDIYASDRVGVIRPVLQFSEDSILFKIITSNRKIGPEGVFEVEFGKYPQISSDTSIQEILDEEYLKPMKETYTFDSRKYNEWGKKFLPVTYPEYEYNGKRYIRMEANPFKESCMLSNGIVYKYGDYVWLEVPSVLWQIDDKNKRLIAKKGLVSGIQFISVGKKYYGDFSATNLKEYFDKYMFHDLFQSTILMRGNNIITEEYIAKEIASMLKSHSANNLTKEVIAQFYGINVDVLEEIINQILFETVEITDDQGPKRALLNKNED